MRDCRGRENAKELRECFKTFEEKYTWRLSLAYLLERRKPFHCVIYIARYSFGLVEFARTLQLEASTAKRRKPILPVELGFRFMDLSEKGVDYIIVAAYPSLLPVFGAQLDLIATTASNKELGMIGWLDAQGRTTKFRHYDELEYRVMQWKVGTHEDIDAGIAALMKDNRNLRVMDGWKHSQLRTEKSLREYITTAGPRGEDEVKQLPDGWNDTGGGDLDEFDEDSASSDSNEILIAGGSSEVEDSHEIRVSKSVTTESNRGQASEMSEGVVIKIEPEHDGSKKKVKFAKSVKEVEIIELSSDSD